MIFNIFLILLGLGVGYFFGTKRVALPPENPIVRISKEDPPLSVPVKVCISKGGIPIVSKDGVLEDCVFPPYEGASRRAK